MVEALFSDYIGQHSEKDKNCDQLWCLKGIKDSSSKHIKLVSIKNKIKYLEKWNEFIKIS